MKLSVQGKCHPTKEANLKKGYEAEDRLLSTFKDCFCKDLIKDENQWAVMDYFCDCCMVELKSRNVKKDTYKTTMVGMNKINFALRNSKKASYFVFEFTDGLYYWKLNKDELETFEKRKGGTTKRGEVEQSEYLFIPVDILINIKEKPSPNCYLWSELPAAC
jgi:hypothetical protein